MNFPWAICIAREDAASLAAVRLTAGLEVAEVGAHIWLRSRRSDETLALKLAALPAFRRFEWMPPSQLRQIDERVPSTRLPEARWQSIDAWLLIEVPAAALPALEPSSVSLKLVRSTEEREAELLLTGLEEFLHFTRQAAQVRLERLRFAADPNGRVLVRGTPLPPLPGDRFVLHGNVAVPSGFAWQAAVSAEVLSRRFGASGEALVLWNAEGTITSLHSEHFVAVSRSAVRATAEAWRESA